MRLSCCKVVALALCLGLLLLLYLFLGNADDEPPLKVARETHLAEHVSSGPPGGDGVAAPPLHAAHFRPILAAAAAAEPQPEEEEAAQVSKREPRPHKKTSKRSAAARGKFANVRYCLPPPPPPLLVGMIGFELLNSDRNCK